MRWTPAHRGLAIVPVAALALVAGLGHVSDAEAATAGIHHLSPTSGSTVSGTVVWEAAAKRSSVVTRVDFRLDGRLVWTERTAPFRYGDDRGELDTTTLSNGSHTLKVTAYEKRGRRGSATAKVTVENAARDTTPPSTPSGLTVTGASGSRISVSWSPSSDAVGVAGYRVALDGAAAGDTTGTGTSFADLACGTSHQVAVDAFDAAGNRSAKATLSASTSPCPPPPPPPPPPPAAEPAAPLGGISAPLAGAVVSGSIPFLVDADPSLVARVDMYVNGGLVASEKTAPYGFGGSDGAPGLDTTGFADGTARLRAVIVGTDGRQEASEVPVTIANLSGAPAPTPGPDPEPEPAPPPSTGTASVFVATSGSDANACTAPAPCASFERAYTVARPGDVVQVADGSYGHQTIPLQAAKTSSQDVVIRPAAGASVTLSYLSVYGRHVEIRDMRTGGFYVRPGAADLTLRDVVSTDASFITSADDVSLIGGEIRNADSRDGLQVKMAGGGAHEPTNLLIDGVYIHDITRVSDPTAHTECIQFTAGRNVTIRNSRFVACSTQGVFFKEGLGGQIDGVLVENNWFGKIAGQNTLIFDDGVSNMTARYNSFAQPPRLGGGVGTANLVAYGNAGVMGSCGVGVSYRYNVWSGVACSSTDVKSSPGFVSEAGFDLRLAAGSSAIDRGDPSVHPATDMFGAGRPKGGRADAGAHELT